MHLWYENSSDLVLSWNDYNSLKKQMIFNSDSIYMEYFKFGFKDAKSQSMIGPWLCCKIIFYFQFLCLNVTGAFLRWSERHWIFSMVLPCPCLQLNSQRRKPQCLKNKGQSARRSATTMPQQLDGDACKEAISFFVHSPDEASVFQKMKVTFQHHRQDLVHDP